jgi:HD-GYP domain-containing protein (c-di-GMP phosphodiesterase class II)
MREGFQSAGEVARRIAQRMAASASVQNALPYLFEQWDGKGMPLGLRGEAIPLLARIVFPSSYLEVAHRAAGRDAALRLARDRRKHAFDPAVVDAFEALSRRGEFWEPLETGSAWPAVRPLLPDGNSSGPDEFAACCADFVDMKSFWLAGHSRRVADLSERLARRLRFAEDDVFEIRFASLIHDLGLVAIPSFVLNKSGEQHTPGEATAIEGHGETVRALLSPFGALETVSEIAGAHHRSSDDATNGHPSAETVSAAAHVISLASQYDALTHDGPGTRGLPPDEAISMLTARRDAEPWTDVAHILGDEVAGISSRAAVRGLPRGLTGREAEVLRHLARGLSRRQIAEALVVSESTVRAHLEHIYTKIGVSTKVGAVLFAMENGLTP